MGAVLPFPRERQADLRIDFCDVEEPADDDRLPPHDLAAEQAVVSACILSHAVLLVVLELLRPEHFWDHANGRIWQAIQHLAVAQTPVDFVSVFGWLRDREWLGKMGGSAYLATLEQAAPNLIPANIEAHAGTVLEKWQDRQTIATCQRVAAERRRDVGDRASWYATARTELGRVTAPRVKLAGKPIGAVVQEARAHIAQVVSGRVVGVRYPWPSVETMLGLMVTGRQSILAGDTGQGKTALALQIAKYAAETGARDLEWALAHDHAAPDFGEAVYVLSGEMKGKYLLVRFACSLAGVNVLHLECGMATLDEQERVGRALGVLQQLPIIIDDKPAPPAEIARRVRAHKAAFASGQARRADGELYPKCRLRLVIGDHAQTLARQSEGREEKDRIGNCAEGWDEEIAKACDVHTMLLSQVKRPVYEKGGKPAAFPPWPRLHDLWGSSKLEMSADTVFAVQRPEKLITGKIPAKWLGVAALCLLKGRFGDEQKRVLLGGARGAFSEELPAAMVQAIDAAGGNYSDEDEERGGRS